MLQQHQDQRNGPVTDCHEMHMGFVTASFGTFLTVLPAVASLDPVGFLIPEETD